jgi:membrane carboxypeptidase/penicillin-binding protein PbpC
LLPDRPLAGQELFFTAASGEMSRPVYWFVDDRLVAEQEAGRPLFWTPETGTHQVVCSDRRGYADRISIVVE